MREALPLIAAFGTALLLGWVMRRAGIIDRLNQRSNHDRPTPRGQRAREDGPVPCQTVRRPELFLLVLQRRR